MELHARDGVALVVYQPPPEATGREETGWSVEVGTEELELPDELVRALREWARVTGAVLAGGEYRGGAARALITQRGRVLTRRLALALGTPIGFVDPITGGVEPVDPHPPVVEPDTAGGPPEPTPYATGITVSVIVGLVITLIVVTLSQGLAEAGVWLAVAANLLIGGGLAPSLWLARNLPTWRWVALGTACGIGLAWVTLLIMSVSVG